jgi:hypothetical protein
MIRKDTTFSLSGVTSHLIMKYDVEDNTTTVLGFIQHRETKKRKGPPDCGNGFDTSYLPFAKGHVIALELGGSDDKYNVVPQFEHWQGKPNGAWRMMENALGKPEFASCWMQVDVGYGRIGGEEAHQTARVEFEQDLLRDWTDPRIPDIFRVRVWDGTLDLSKINNDLDFDKALVELGKSMQMHDESFNLGTGVPEPDRNMFIVQMALSATLEKHAALTRQVSMLSYLLEPGTVTDVRTTVAAEYGVTATEAAGLQAFPIMKAYQDGVTEPKIQKKILKRKAEGEDTAGDAELGIDTSHRGKKAKVATASGGTKAKKTK